MLTQQQAYHGLDKSPEAKGRESRQIESDRRFVARVWAVCFVIALIGVAGLVFVAKWD